MKLITFIILSYISNLAYGNVIINGTRIIYNENAKEITVQLINKGDSPSLIQSWIDDGDINSTPENSNVPFILSPPVVKVTGNNGQQLSIKKTSQFTLLPKDRESIFYLNVLDIPPIAENMKGKNTMQLAIKSRIKLFYRPSSLSPITEDDISLLSIHVNSAGLKIEINGHFYITIANIENESNKKILDDSFMIPPYSKLEIENKIKIKKGNKYKLLYIDDFGAYKSKSLTAI